MIEYALILTLIGTVSVGAAKLLGTTATGVYSNVASALSNTTSGSGVTFGTATVVYGQNGTFSTSTTNNTGGVGGTISASSLHTPADMALDSSGNLYVVENGNMRVLKYPAGSSTATTVYGQNGSFTSALVNNTGGSSGIVSSTSLNNPWGIALDSSGNLYVADDWNNRVLYYPAGSTTATRVYGQNGSFSTNLTNNTSGVMGTISATSLSEPHGLALDSSGDLYVADYGNNRVLYYPAGSTTATRVYGQGGSFTTGTANKGGISANSLNLPQGVALDSSGNLYVADPGNNRVLYYSAGSTTATVVYGQNGSFTSALVNNTGGVANTVSATSLNYPEAARPDSGGNLYVSDYSNRRVLYYPAGSTTATRVYGQNGSFTTNLSNNTGGVGGTISATSLSASIDVLLDSSGDLYVGDSANNRILEYQ